MLQVLLHKCKLCGKSPFLHGIILVIIVWDKAHATKLAVKYILGGQMMKKRTGKYLIRGMVSLALAAGIFLAPTIANGSGASVQTHNVTYSGGTKSVSVIWTDLKDDRVRVETVLAKGEVGKTDTLVNMVNSVTDSDGKGVAGINGSFFEAYTDFQPSGTLISAGEVRHISNTGSLFTVDADGKADVGSVYIGIEGGINNQWEWPNNWYAWNINHFYKDPSAVMVFDSNYNGPKPVHSFTSIMVDGGRVSEIGKGSFSIPQDGFLLLTNDQEMISKFKVGAPADFRYGFFENDYVSKPHTGRELDFSSIRSATGAGPTLVKDGQILADPAKEGFTEDKILSNRARRSFIGITADGRLGFGSLDGVNVKELAEIAKALGMVDAMNLDGGASSGTVYNGKNLVREGRLLSNAIVIKYLDQEPISVKLNGEKIIFDSDPFFDANSNRNLVPLRGIAESLGAKVGWDQATSSVLIDRQGTSLRLKVGSRDVYVNGEKEVMDVPVALRNSRTYVPVRFITEFFGGEVGWNGATKTVELNISRASDTMEKAESLYSSGNMEGAESLYLEVLEVEKNNIIALKRMANIYGVQQKDYKKAIGYYERIVEIDKTDAATLHALGWAYYNEKDMEDAIGAFQRYIDLDPSAPAGYYGIAQCYSSYTMQEEGNAKKYYQMAIDRGLSGAGLEYARDYLGR
jgi:hypothetical protein